MPASPPDRSFFGGSLDGSFDVIVVGSGFGGSVSALRLSEKGYRVAVMESGKRFGPDEFPRTSWDVRRFLWLPYLGCRGIQRLDFMRDVAVLSGAGVGGGSLVYANTLYRAADGFYTDPAWGHLADWKAELAPHYETAERMLGVTETPADTPVDEIMLELADHLGVAETYRRTPVGVYFGRTGKRASDPFFDGRGPDRSGCLNCGECMTGCRHGAKNSLDLNYLYLAERNGVNVLAERRVVDVRPRPGGGYEVTTERPGAWFRQDRRTYTCDQVVVSASALGTQRLLSRLKESGSLPCLSDRLGWLVRTNSEAIVTAEANTANPDFTTGVAITSSIHPDDDTHIEPVRYGKGSNVMGLLTTIMLDGEGRRKKFFAAVRNEPRRVARSLNVRRWSERSIILLVMQSVDNSLRLQRIRRWGMSMVVTRPGDGEPSPTWIPVANESARHVAERIGGSAHSSLSEALFDVPTTAHLIGGCPMGDSAETGVVDKYHRVFGYDGLHVIDGSTLTANLGVNPSLTITAMAERAMSYWPTKGEPDQRN